MVLEKAAGPSAEDESTPSDLGVFADHASIASAVDADALLDVLYDADWTSFAAERDLPPLRARLWKLEQDHGITDAHHFATRRIRDLADTRLQQPFGHVTEIESSAASPCGRYLATGSWVGDEYHRGGVLQIWETATGRCVNVLHGVPGGVGWPDYDGAIQWSDDGTRVGLAYNTNQVGVFDPFAVGTGTTYPLASADVTDGSSRPPHWALAPDGRSAYVASGSPCAIRGCVVPLEAGDLFWLPNYAPSTHPYLLNGTLPDGVAEDDLSVLGWSPDGARLHAYDARTKRDLAIDLATKEVTWAPENEAASHAASGELSGALSGDTSGDTSGEPSVAVSVDGTRVTFRRPGTGEVLGDFTFLREPPSDPLLEHPYAFEGINFALDDGTWCAAFEEGLVIGPPDRREDLEAVLAWSVDRRFAWPVRWGGLEIVPDVRTAAELLNETGPGHYVREIVQELDAAGTTVSPAKDGIWPPPNTATTDDLFAAAKEAASVLGGNWNFAVNEELRGAARLRARRGEPEGAVELLDAIPDADQRVMASAEVAMILARAGLPEQARPIFAYAEAHAEASLTPHDSVDITSAMAGAHQALGDQAAADAWFTRARAGIATDSNPWNKRLRVIWALTECGRVDEARELWAPDEVGDQSSLDRDTEPWLLYLVGTGRLDLAEEFLEAWVPPGMDRPSSLIRPLTELGRPDLLRSWLDGCWYIPDETYERAQAVADGAPSRSLPPTPTEADVADLTEAHVAWLKTPRARRKIPVRDLVQKAADLGHLSAVLDLLGELPTDDFNDRAAAAFSALWIVSTGHDRAPW
ncbi:hypothetical protein EBO15_00755 [Actinomadura harenae]|uniref:WD40 repeat domain-containing protein n=2 Tax=Actinomadura harenae TaxID=2483351 RepID=A0A3M2MG66_9ACTN|nr:hypothetical protein EBO15_00755 [Actinomadura harenae]